MYQKCYLEKTFNKRKISIENFTPFCSFRLGRVIEAQIPSKNEGTTEIGHSIIMTLNARKSNFENQWWCWFHICSLWHFITKCDSYFITKCNFKKYDSFFYYKMLQFYCNLLQLLQIQKLIARCVDTTFEKKNSELLKEMHYKVKDSWSTAALFQLLNNIIYLFLKTCKKV